MPPIDSDARLLRLIVTNLVSNAIKFTDKGTVVVSYMRVGDEYRVDVRDSGPGIAVPDQQRIFEPFEQLAPISAKHIPGVGLGLALVRELVKAIGARVSLQSTPGAGATFTLVLSASSQAN